MDGLSAVSLAGNVAQFLEYGVRLVRTTREIATSTLGISQEVAELELILNDLDATMKLLKGPDNLGNKDRHSDETLRNLVENCNSLIPNITRIIERLQLKKNGESRPRQAYGAIRKAAHTLYKKGEIDQVSNRLFSLRSQISAHMIILIEQQQRELQHNLLTFSATTDQFQTRFKEDLELSLRNLERISKNVDSLAAKPSFIGARAYKDLVTREREEQNAWASYKKETTDFYRKELDKLMDQKRKAIQKSLSFDQLYERESVIPEAHRRTFEWMLAPSTDQKFVEWLRNESGTFWISGKAGAGKSTLMKFLVDNDTTQQELAVWAEGNLVIAKHFFWRPGTPLQRSQDGLFRSILLQILKARPGLLPSVCDERWLGPYPDSFLPWSRSQLLKAMRRLKSMLEAPGISTTEEFKLCLFVDGLDEFEGDHFELIRILRDFTESARVKMCASSRPWLEFFDAFGGTPWKVQVHDLTRQDMLLYVRDKLGADDKFARLRTKDAALASDMITSVVTRAEGVFLWLYLVVRSLLRGLRFDDDLRDLQRRMEALPEDLEAFFSRMLNEIEDVYRQRTARLFLTLSIARKSLPVITFFFLNFDDEPVQVEPRTLSSLEKWLDVDPFLLESLETKKRQLIAQCKDIIHITPEREAPLLFGDTVGFLHRTVFDFINTEETYSKLERLAGPSYEPRKPLFIANIGQVNAMIHLHPRTFIKPHLKLWILGTLFYAYEMEVATACSGTKFVNDGLDELNQIISEQFAKWDFRHAMSTLLGRGEFVSFTHLAAVCDLASYVQYKCANITPEKLDVLAPGWRSPSRIEQFGTFEIIPQTSDVQWRLGNVFGISFEVESCSTTDEATEEPEERLYGLQSYGLKEQSGRVHRGLRKFASIWRRS